MPSLILASASSTRQTMLSSAGVTFRVKPAHIDERAIEADVTEGQSIAQELATAKAKAVSFENPASIVLGADQTLSLNGEAFHKPIDLNSARKQLMTLRGHTHTLHSAASLVRQGHILNMMESSVHITFRNFSEAFIDDYLSRTGNNVTQSVGGYQIEGLGAQLVEKIDGDWFTILGLPLFDVLQALRQHGLLKR